MFRFYDAKAFPGSGTEEISGLSPVCMGTLQAAPNYEVRPRILKDYYLIYFLEGKGHLQEGGRHFSIVPGDLFLLYPGIIHAYRTDPKNLIHMYWIGFQGSEVTMLSRKAGFTQEQPCCHCGRNPEVLSIIRQMMEDSRDNRPSDFLALIGGIYRLFGAVIRQELPELVWTQKNTVLSDVVNDAQNFINIHYPQHISIAELARKMGVSRATLTAKFRKELGQTPVCYLTYVRLRQAKNLLEYTNYTIAEISHSVGYEDALYFSKVFINNIGCSPSDYRKLLRFSEHEISLL